MRLGGPILERFSDPGEWAGAVKRLGYRAAYSPIGPEEAGDRALDYARAAREADIVIAEVGAWSNPLSPDAKTAGAAMETNRRALALADIIGARCAVNIAGSRGKKWDGPHPDDLAPEAFDRVVQSVRGIIDDVKPARAFYTIETMPWMHPDSPDDYLALIRAVDRKQFGAHLDPANMITSPRRYFGNGEFIRECFRKLGPYIKSCHAKDIILGDQMTTHLSETRPGLGGLDYRVYIEEAARLDADLPVMLEHLKTAEEYALAAEHVRSAAASIGVAM
jgi:sugar phosphate isomerase/epimerase